MYNNNVNKNTKLSNVGQVKERGYPMASNKEDLRVSRTKQQLKDALLSILRIKPIGRITVTELCRKAGLNRNTFYSHYRSPVELLDEIETTFFRSLGEPIEGLIKSGSSYESVIRHLTQMLYQEPDLAKLLFFDSTTPLHKKFSQMCYQVVVQHWSDRESGKRESLPGLYTYLYGGTREMLHQWIDGGFRETPEEITKEIVFFNSTLLTESFLNSRYSK